LAPAPRPYSGRLAASTVLATEYVNATPTSGERGVTGRRTWRQLAVVSGQGTAQRIAAESVENENLCNVHRKARKL
jgi:hypothetical protein